MTDKTENSQTENEDSQTETEDSQTENSQTENSQTEITQTEITQNQLIEPGAGMAGEVEFIASERLIFFTDAVVAIAMTLLAFGLTTQIADRAGDRAALVTLGHGVREYLAFLISFVIIGRHWRAHHRLFRYVSSLDARIISLNMIWLLMIVTMPFATRLLSGTGGFAIVFGLYALIQVGTLLTALLMSRHIRANDLLRPGAPGPGPMEDDATLLTVAAMFAISIPLAFATHWGAYAVWVASVPAARLIRRRRKRN
jgi:uncharacterized membrane protein